MFIILPTLPQSDYGLEIIKNIIAFPSSASKACFLSDWAISADRFDSEKILFKEKQILWVKAQRIDAFQRIK